jgi:hypothetical protein
LMETQLFEQQCTIPEWMIWWIFVKRNSRDDINESPSLWTYGSTIIHSMLIHFLIQCSISWQRSIKPDRATYLFLTKKGIVNSASF